MGSRNLAKPNFPLAPDTYNKQFMDTLVQSFSTYLQQSQNAGEERATTTVLTDVPTDPTDLEPGSVYNDNTLLRIVTGGAPGTITLPELEVTTEFTSSGITTLSGTTTATGNATFSGTTTLFDGTNLDLFASDIDIGTSGSSVDIYGNITFRGDVGTLSFVSFDIEGDFLLDSVQVTATAEQLNYTAVTTLGVAENQKVLTTDASGDLDFGDNTIDNIRLNDARLVGSTSVAGGDTFGVYGGEFIVRQSGTINLDSTGTLELDSGADFTLNGVSLTQQGSLTALGTTSFSSNTIPVYSSSSAVSAYAFRDEDNMASNSATSIPSQQSVKAYVDNTVDDNAIGIGQSWSDISASKAIGTPYQNTSGRPVQVSVSGGTGGTIEVSANGSTWITIGAADYTNQFIVPDNHYYRQNGGTVATTWALLS